MSTAHPSAHTGPHPRLATTAAPTGATVTAAHKATASEPPAAAVAVAWVPLARTLAYMASLRSASEAVQCTENPDWAAGRTMAGYCATGGSGSAQAARS